MRRAPAQIADEIQAYKSAIRQLLHSADHADDVFKFTLGVAALQHAFKAASDRCRKNRIRVLCALRL